MPSCRPWLVALAVTWTSACSSPFCVQEEVSCTTTCDDLHFECAAPSAYDQYGGLLPPGTPCTAGRCEGLLAQARAACAGAGRDLAQVWAPRNEAREDRVVVCANDALPAGGGGGSATGGGTGAVGGGFGGGGGGESTGGGSGGGFGGGGAQGGGSGSGARCTSSSSIECTCATGVTQAQPNEVFSCSPSTADGPCCATSAWPSNGSCECGKFRCHQRDATSCECVLGVASLSDSQFTLTSCSPAPRTVCCLENVGLSSGVVCACGRVACPAGVQQVSSCSASVDVCVAQGRRSVSSCL